MPGPYSRQMDQNLLGKGPGICLFNTLPGDADAAGPGTALRELLY